MLLTSAHKQKLQYTVRHWTNDNSTAVTGFDVLPYFNSVSEKLKILKAIFKETIVFHILLIKDLFLI